MTAIEKSASLANPPVDRDLASRMTHMTHLLRLFAKCVIRHAGAVLTIFFVSAGIRDFRDITPDHAERT